MSADKEIRHGARVKLGPVEGILGCTLESDGDQTWVSGVDITLDEGELVIMDVPVFNKYVEYI